ncbi:protein-disulfide reductase DsbD family protein [Microbulbifer sp.]|uniref:protein-disulfide reductase DsbD family protein n=1 Tax=Microbulbifer sp. TaxID=1908541 RepID=UPI003F3FC7BA
MQKTRYTTVELIAEQATVPVDGGTITLGLYLEPAPAWHAYWSNPGDAGKEPSVAWHLPEGFAAGGFAFPAPHRLPLGELNTYGYEEPILLLADLAVPGGLTAGETIDIRGKARWVVCDDEICVPDRANVSVSLPVGDGAVDAKVARRFTEARSAIPEDAQWPASFSIAGGKVSIDIAPADARLGFDDAYLFIESRNLVRYDSQSMAMTDRGLSFVMNASSNPDGEEVTRAVLTFTAADGNARAVALDIAKSTPASVPASTGPGGGPGFVRAVVFAFIGGIILNLMPCVFPILSMKALSLVNLGGRNQRVARESGVIYTAGVLVAFAAIAMLLLALRSAGEAVGWGFQMQHPPVVVGLGLLMVAVGVNLLGVYEIGTRIMGVGGRLPQGGERKEAFFTGLLAVVVATPCMAPFMAAALGYAVTQPAAVSLTVFLTLGLGLAFPYLVLSFVPALGRMLPKPGAWMETFKHLLAFPLFITALWLFWIVGQQLGATSMFVGLLSATAVAFALWAYGKGASGRKKGIWYPTAMAGALAAIFAFTQVEASKTMPRAAGDESAGKLGGLQLEHFDENRVKEYIAAEQPTFVYFTADWCISCKANERVALATDQVAEAFNSRGIRVVEGDWTTEDLVITRWLEMYGRAGVPLYLYFPKGSSLKTVSILPQVLTPGIVIDAIKRADTARIQHH